MADERAQVDRGGPMSEQQEAFEPQWGTADVRGRGGATGASGPQYVGADDDGDFTDDEPTAIAGEAGSTYLLGPEDAAMHVEDEEGRPVE
jgi:hypothetical protein